MFTALVAAALLSQSTPNEPSTAAAAPAAVPPRLLASELGLGLGVVGVGYGFLGGRQGDLLVERVLEGRLVLAGPTADASVSFPMPTSGGGAATGLGAVVRIGWTGQRWSFVAGPSFQLVTHAEPSSQWLPSLRASYAFARWGLSLGVFDFYSTVPAHLTVEVGDYGVGYVAPLGALVTARFRLRDYVGLKVTALAFRLFNAEVGMVTLTASVGPSWGVKPGGAR